MFCKMNYNKIGTFLVNVEGNLTLMYSSAILNKPSFPGVQTRQNWAAIFPPCSVNVADISQVVKIVALNVARASTLVTMSKVLVPYPLKLSSLGLT